MHKSSFNSHVNFTKLSQNDHYQMLQRMLSGCCDLINSGEVTALRLVILNIAFVRNSFYISHVIFTRLAQNEQCRVPQCMYSGFSESSISPGVFLA